jgi:hypothetical protein
MNKLLRSMTMRMQPANNANEDYLRPTPSTLDLTINVDAETWRYFENLDEDSRAMMARVLKDYVEKQK